jgi:hypothetical protein
MLHYLSVAGWFARCCMKYIKSVFGCGVGQYAGHVMADHPLQKHMTVPDDSE